MAIPKCDVATAVGGGAAEAAATPVEVAGGGAAPDEPLKAKVARGGGTDDGLPFTGMQLGGAMVLGGLLMLTGAGMHLRGRGRRQLTR